MKKRKLDEAEAMLDAIQELEALWGDGDSLPPQGPDYERDAEILLTMASEGDRGAAEQLVEAAQSYAIALQVLFGPWVWRDSSHPGPAILKQIAERRLDWPCLVSRHRSGTLTPENLRSYLDRLNLGHKNNLHSDKIDSRTMPFRPAVAVIYNSIKNRGKTELLRAGLPRDKWLSSEYGKAVKKEVMDLLEVYPLEKWRSNLVLAPLIQEATKTASHRLRYRNGLEPGASVEPTDRAVKTALIKEVCSLIHGMLLE